MLTSTTNEEREVAGYRLTERLGSGGFGEVWKAEAPGGMFKAVKMIYGFHDESRASRELKSLNRIKSVRHPFLLSLERIEVVNGQLVVVTELADKSLKDQFDSYREKSESGIPRAELLRYLIDCAEALDFLSFDHQLLHLDIKPENLLIVGSHAKVADFGLVKSMQDTAASMMAGLTPVYASPEVFHDEPNRFSDQYSLAIVFQEMLTGELPFPGKTPAQLTAQHLSSKPRLNALPESDRPIIAKALAKESADRFANSCEMIQALMQATSSENQPSPSAAGNLSSDASLVKSSDTKTICGSDTNPTILPDENHLEKATDAATIHLDADDPTPLSFEDLTWHELPNLAPEDASPVEWNSEGLQFRPTLFLTIGGTGSRLAALLDHQYRDLYAADQQQPWLKTIVLDTDTRDLEQVRQGLRLPGTNIVATPLRRPQAYRNAPERLTRSLSRRWLYNIPHSLATEGLRPLGRLAYIDHFLEIKQQIVDRLREAIKAATVAAENDPSLTINSTQPRVVVVGSISGGTGSGMILDIAFLAKSILEEMGLESKSVETYLLHSTQRGGEEQDLAKANALACLTELNHYAKLQNYPGDSSTGSATVEYTAETENSFRLISLGNGLSNAEYEDQLKQISHLLFLQTRCEVGGYIEKLFHTDERLNSEASIATAAIHSVAPQTMGSKDENSSRLALGVIHRWLGVSQENTGDGHRMAKLNDSELKESSQLAELKDRLSETLNQFIEQSELMFEQMIPSTIQIIESELECGTDQYFRTLVETQWTQPDGGWSALPEHQRSGAVLKYLDQIIGQASGELGTSETSQVSLHNEIAPQLEVLADATSKQASAWLMKQMDHPGIRLQGARRLHQLLNQHFVSVEEKARTMQGKLSEELYQLREQILSKSAQSHGNQLTDQSIKELWIKYAHLKTHSVVLIGNCKLAQLIRASIMKATGQIKSIETQLLSIEESVRAGHDTLEADFQDPRFLELNQLAEKWMDEQVVAPQGGLYRLLTQMRNGEVYLQEHLLNACHEFIIKAADSTELSLAENSDAKYSPEELASMYQECEPTLARLGGQRRWSIFQPQKVGQQQDQQKIDFQGHQVSVIDSQFPETVYCQTIQSISLRDSARLLVDNRPEYLELAARLVTRTDVEWARI
ncbi:MAG: hypothetical protein COA78_08360 [Blastopirellula sp.]|nr:MAG: hypothetical protein COA78_08360 [Blastopirellula sp.]